jgi:hypothetical protein
LFKLHDVQTTVLRLKLHRNDDSSGLSSSHFISGVIADSAQKNTVRLKNFMGEAYARQEDVVVLVFFDLEKTNNTAWKYVLLHDLLSAGLRDRLPALKLSFS